MARKGERPRSLEEHLAARYAVELVEDESGGFVARIPDLPGCVTQGETKEEALELIEDARQAWLESAWEHGDHIPEPGAQAEFSGRLNLRMSKSLHRRLHEEARREGVSLNQHMVNLLQERSALREAQVLRSGSNDSRGFAADGRA